MVQLWGRAARYGPTVNLSMEVRVSNEHRRERSDAVRNRRVILEATDALLV